MADLEALGRVADTQPMKLRISCVRAAWLCAACLPLAGCGGAQGHSPSAAGDAASVLRRDASATVSAGSPAASDTPSRAQALAFARAVNLTASDIPEASVEKRPFRSSDASEREEYRACERLVGMTEGHAVARATSPKLERGQELEIELMTSSVTVLSDEHTLARQVELLASSTLLKCIAHVMTRDLDDKPIRDARWGRVTVSKFPVNAPGASATFGIRIVARLNLPFSEVTVPIYGDALGFAVGRAAVTLVAVSATQPVPSNTEQELLALLLARARAHTL